LGRAILSLWQAMSGGVDWDDLAAPLLYIHVMHGVMFVAYIAFAVLALLNVVTGVFVQTALQSAKVEEDNFMTDQIVQLFEVADKDASASISWDEIQASLDNPGSAKEWKSIGVHSEEAHHLFQLLDVEHTGEVAFDEFLGGCLRLNGPSKSIDMLTVMQEGRRQKQRTQDLHDEVRDGFASMNEKMSGHIAGQKSMEIRMEESLEGNHEALKYLTNALISAEKCIEDLQARLQPLELLEQYYPAGNDLV